MLLGDQLQCSGNCDVRGNKLRWLVTLPRLGHDVGRRPGPLRKLPKQCKLLVAHYRSDGR
jgi:hypothetical protein